MQSLFQSDVIHNLAGNLKDYYFLFNRTGSIFLAFFISTVECTPQKQILIFFNSQASCKINLIRLIKKEVVYQCKTVVDFLGCSFPKAAPFPEFSDPSLHVVPTTF
jgi:hypothetical protein